MNPVSIVRLVRASVVKALPPCYKVTHPLAAGGLAQALPVTSYQHRHHLFARWWPDALCRKVIPFVGVLQRLVVCQNGAGALPLS